MTRIGRVVTVTTFAGWLLVGAPAFAAGGGGACFEEPPALDAGWVAVADNCFSPQAMEVRAGQTVRWQLEGEAPHTVTFEDGPDAGTLTDAGFAVTFNAPGVYPYSCTIHPAMTATVSVTGSSVGGPAVVATGGGTTPAAGTLQDEPAVARDALPTRLEFSPLTAAVILLIGLPLSLAATLRLAGFAGRPAVRLRVPWEAATPAAEPRRR